MQNLNITHLELLGVHIYTFCFIKRPGHTHTHVHLLTASTQVVVQRFGQHTRRHSHVDSWEQCPRASVHNVAGYKSHQVAGAPEQGAPACT